MFPRTLRCSTATGFLPLSVNLTCFRCVFMLTSTPARVENKAPESHHRQSNARRERLSRASRGTRLAPPPPPPPRAVANSSRLRRPSLPPTRRARRARRSTRSPPTTTRLTRARLPRPSLALVASPSSRSRNRARTHDRPVRRRAILQLDRHALVGEFLKETHELHRLLASLAPSLRRRRASRDASVVVGRARAAPSGRADRPPHIHRS